ncbi:MAG: hypothetical protein JXB10_12790 [Pirellulales bacterium]|nr:hypothetical protein [Pirellulales bacterium]
MNELESRDPWPRWIARGDRDRWSRLYTCTTTRGACLLHSPDTGEARCRPQPEPGPQPEKRRPASNNNPRNQYFIFPSVLIAGSEDGPTRGPSARL